VHIKFSKLQGRVEGVSRGFRKPIQKLSAASIAVDLLASAIHESVLADTMEVYSQITTKL